MSSSVSSYRPTIHTRTGSRLEQAYAYLRVAQTTEDRRDFLGALQGAIECADKLFYSDRRMVMERVFEIQNERGPRIVPEQLGGVSNG
jgi:hypothetical protein